jgi:hypothetical protein
MKSTRLYVGTLVLAAGILLPTTRAVAQTVGFVAALEGTVEIRSAGVASWEAALLDRDVALGDVVRTGPDGGAKILLADDTILTVGDDTELEIDSYVVGPAATSDPSVLRLLKGKARTVVGERFGGTTRIEVHTPTAVIGVKGTAFDTYVLADAMRGMWTLCCNVQGSIFVKHLTQPGSVAPGTGFCAELYPDTAPGDEIPRPEWAAPIEGPPGGLPTPQVDLLDPDTLPPVQSQPDVEQFADGVEKDRGDIFEGVDQTVIQQTDLEGGGMPPSHCSRAPVL